MLNGLHNWSSRLWYNVYFCNTKNVRPFDKTKIYWSRGKRSILRVAKCWEAHTVRNFELKKSPLKLIFLFLLEKRTEFCIDARNKPGSVIISSLLGHKTCPNCRLFFSFWWHICVGVFCSVSQLFDVLSHKRTFPIQDYQKQKQNKNRFKGLHVVFTKQ